MLNGVVVPARHAYSHSASVGKRQPIHVAKAVASSQVTFITGRSPRPQPPSLGFSLPVVSQNKSYCLKVISYLLILKALNVTRCWVSLLSLQSSRAGLPIVKVPAGMIAHVMVDLVKSGTTVGVLLLIFCSVVSEFLFSLEPEEEINVVVKIEMINIFFILFYLLLSCHGGLCSVLFCSVLFCA